MKTKQDMVNEVHAGSDVSKKTIERVIQDFVEVLRSNIEAGNEVRIQELGIFKIATRAAHKGRNPATGEMVDVPEKRFPQLKFNRAIRRALNGD